MATSRDSAVRDGDSLDADNDPASPSPASRRQAGSALGMYAPSLGQGLGMDTTLGGGLAFKPPPKPGSSARKARQTTSSSSTGRSSALSDSASGVSRDDNSTSLVEEAQSADLFHNGDTTPSPPGSPASTTSGPSRYDGAPASDAAQTLAATMQCRQRLQSLRELNENELHAAGLLGNGLVEQRQRIDALMDELAEELNEVDEAGYGADDAASKERITMLREKIDEEVEEMQSQRTKLYSELSQAGGTGPPVMPLSPSKQANKPALSFLQHDSAGFLGTPSRTASSNGVASGPTPRQSDRRARNAAARTSIADQGLVNQIQEGLVVEVRRLQALLLERDAELALVRGAKDEVEKEVAVWKPRALHLIESEDALKQENWDLSVARQDLEEKLEGSQTAHKKAEAENIRLNRELLRARELSDAQRVQINEATSELEKVRSLRETETALARKDRATMQRDMSDLQSEMQRLREPRLSDRSNISRSVSNSLTVDASRMLGIDEDEDTSQPRDAGLRRDSAFADGDTSTSGPSFSDELSPAVSPLGKRLTRDQEVQELRAKLNKSQQRAARGIADRRLQREKNNELKRQLAQAGIDVPESSGDDDSDGGDEDWIEEPHQSASGKRLARMRIPKSSTHRSFANRLGLGMPTQDTGAQDDEDEEEFYDDEGEIDDSGDAEPSVDVDSSAAQMSADGIDPNFGDALRSDFAAPASQRRVKGRRSTIRATQGAAPGSPSARGARGGSPDSRTASMVFEAGALGSELAAAGLDEPQNNSAQTDGSRETVQAQQKEMASQNTQTESAASSTHVKSLTEGSVMTEPQADVLGPALRAKDEEHAAILGVQQESHNRALADLQTQHSTALDELKADHLDVLAQRDAAHQDVTSQLKAAHEQTLGERDVSHESALSERDARHASALAAALAEKTKTHEAALAEARSRHTRALEEQVAAGGAAVAAAELAHKKALEQRDRARTSEVDKLTTTHAATLAKTHEKHEKAIAQLKESHEDTVHDLQSTHTSFVVQRDKAFNKAISDRDDALRTSAAEVERLKSELTDLRAQLTKSRADLASGQKDLVKSREELKAASESHRTALESAVAAAAAATAISATRKSEDHELDTDAEGFEDAHSGPPTAAVSHAGHGPSEGTEEDDLPRTPADEIGGIRRVNLANLKDMSAQTDDQIWSNYQRRQQSANALKSGSGLLVMGSDNGRDGSAPAMFTADHLVQSPTERASSDTQYSEAVETLPQADKTKPPSLAMPPPPIMPPPADIPRRSIIGPPRPLSPPPPELVQRAQRSRASHLQVPGDRPSSRTSGGAPPSAYVPPPRPGMRPRTTSGESLGSPGDHNSLASGRRSVASRFSTSGKGKRTAQSSAASFASDVTSEMSRRLSVSSSRASDLLADRGSTRGPSGPEGSNAIGTSESTDPSVIHAITQTMIGEYLHKYTRRTMGRAGHSDKRHRRYFWIHPYNNTLYWSVADPAGAGKTTSTDRIAKSGAIQSVQIVEDNNDAPPGLFHQSIIIKTLDRDVKVTAPTRERHQMWVTALGYLISRPGGNGTTAGMGDETALPDGDMTLSPRKARSRAATSGSSAAPLSQRIRMLSPARSFAVLRGNEGVDDRDATPRARGGSIGATTSLGKRRNTAAREYLQRHEHGNQGTADAGPQLDVDRPQIARQSSRQSGKRRSLAKDMFGSSIEGDDSYDPLHDAASSSFNDPRLKTAEQMLEEDEQEGFEGLDNVRACCDGKHDVGSLAHKHRDHTLGTSGRRGTNASSGARSFVSGRSSFSGLRNSRPPSPSPQVTLNVPAASVDSSISSRANAAIMASKTDTSFARFFGSGSGGTTVPSTPTSPGADSTNTDASHANPSYSERVSQIRSARQSSGFR